jgi:putative methionine-R-sulfoxide reductase with GAF domain
LAGVLDIDSPDLDRFTLQDQQLVEAIAAIFARRCEE